MGRLIRYDLTILWRSGRAAFAAKRDLLLLALAVPIATILTIRGLGQAAAAMVDLPLPATLLLPAAVGAALGSAVARRLRHLREESAVARHALRPALACCHGIFWNLAPLAAMMAIALQSAPGDWATVTLFVLSYLAGVGAAQAHVGIWPRGRQWSQWGKAGWRERSVELSGERRSKRVAQLLTARAGLGGVSLRRNLLLLAVMGVGIGAAYRWLGEQVTAPGPAFVTGSATLLLLAILLRLHPPLLRHLVYLGMKPLAPAVLVPCAMASALLAGLLVIGLAGHSHPWALLAGAAILLLGFVSLAALRALHYATKKRQMAQIALQVDLVAVLLIGWLALPLLFPVVAVRLWLLDRRSRAMRHLVV